MVTDRRTAAMPPADGSARFTITVGASTTLDASAPAPVRRAIVDALTLPNPAYREAEENGRSTHDLDPWLSYDRRDLAGGLVVPRGAGDLVRAICKEHGAKYTVVDQTHVAAPVDFAERVTLSPAQERAVGAVLARRRGVLEAPAGSGKTIMAMALIARRQQPTLFIVHTKELAQQAMARAVAVLGLDEEEIGLVGDGQCIVGKRLTVALVQTLARGIPPALLQVGHVVVDEAHHTPAAQLAAVVGQFPARFVLGLTATPYRRDKLDKVIGWYLGAVAARIDKSDLADRLITPAIVKRDTGIALAGDSFTGLVTDLTRSAWRNALIVADVAAAVAMGRRCLVLSDRVGHVEELAALLTAAGVAAAGLHGQLGKRTRGAVVAGLAAGDLRAVVATGSLVGEGFDCPRLDALFLATPVSYGGRVVQYIGRVSRTAPGKDDAIVVDYCDDHGMCWSAWKNRRRVYEHQGCAISSSPAAPTAQRRIA